MGMNMTRRAVLACLILLPVLSGSPHDGTAQGVVVDQGQFAIRIDGRSVGTEDFVIRRAGLGMDDAIFANGVVTLRRDGSTQEIRPLLRATPPDGIPDSYQVTVAGQGAMEVHLARSGRRYIASIRSSVGDEDREYQARVDTRLLERNVAHHYYFLRDAREGRETHTIEPLSRTQTMLTPGPRIDEELQIGPNLVSARRVEFVSVEGDVRVVWFDRQGRVVRVEIPALRYVAERTDLVG
jgi:hypothetical protein